MDLLPFCINRGAQDVAFLSTSSNVISAVLESPSEFVKRSVNASDF